MCLGVPGRVVAWLNRDPTFGKAIVEFAGLQRECHMACVPDVQIGDYVVVHAGIAISCVSEAEARRSFQDFADIARVSAAELSTDTEPPP